MLLATGILRLIASRTGLSQIICILGYTLAGVLLKKRDNGLVEKIAFP